MLQFRLTDPGPLLYHNEPILRDGVIVSQLTSGNYGHAVGGAVGLGYIPCRTPDEPVEEMLGSSYQINVAGQLVTAEAHVRPIYDPRSERVRS